MASRRSALTGFLINLATLVLIVAPAFFVISWLWLNRTELAATLSVLPGALAYNLIVFALPLAGGCALHYALIWAVRAYGPARSPMRAVSVGVSVLLAAIVLGIAGAENIHSVGTAAFWIAAAFAFGLAARFPPVKSSNDSA